jgi:hypothetical protein
VDQLRLENAALRAEIDRLRMVISSSGKGHNGIAGGEGVKPDGVGVEDPDAMKD